MSHYATTWAIRQRGLKPGTKLVLWYLADRHNPDYGCFPSQESLARDAEMSRASVNRHLAALEEMGLIRRVRRTDPATGRVLATRYLLAFEDEFDEAPQTPPCLEMTHGPCLKSDESRVSDCDTNLVIEPVMRMMMKEAGDFRARLLAALGADPETGAIAGEDTSLGTAADMVEAERWKSDLGLTEDDCVCVIADVMRRAPAPPRSFRYFREAMRAFAAARTEAPLAPRKRRNRTASPPIRARLPEEIPNREARDGGA
jgi:DNA-binding MarR family transcriptional regulator